MRIGIDCRMFSTHFTGIGRYTYELVKNLEHLSTTDTEASKHQYILFLNDPEYSAFTPISPNFKKILVNAPHYSLKEQTTFLRILNKENIDLMHFTHFNVPLRYKKPFVVTIHDLTHSIFPGRKMRGLPYRIAYKAVIKNAVMKAKKIIAVSENTKQDLIKMLQIPQEKITVIYEGTNAEYKRLSQQQKDDALTSLKKLYNISQPYLLYTGVHRYHKNLPRLIRAFDKVLEKYQNLQLVITGKEDPLYPEAKQEINRLHLQNKVIYTGLVSEDDLVALYNLSEAYVFPSLYEGFGLPILEAFACGTPVVASKVSSIPEVAGKGNAVFFDPENENDMAYAIISLLADKKLQAELIDRGFERIKDFSWEKMAKEILSVYVA